MPDVLSEDTKEERIEEGVRRLGNKYNGQRLGGWCFSFNQERWDGDEKHNLTREDALAEAKEYDPSAEIVWTGRAVHRTYGGWAKGRVARAVIEDMSEHAYDVVGDVSEYGFNVTEDDRNALDDMLVRAIDRWAKRYGYETHFYAIEYQKEHQL